MASKRAKQSKLKGAAKAACAYFWSNPMGEILESEQTIMVVKSCHDENFIPHEDTVLDKLAKKLRMTEKIIKPRFVP